MSRGSSRKRFKTSLDDSEFNDFIVRDDCYSESVEDDRLQPGQLANLIAECLSKTLNQPVDQLLPSIKMAFRKLDMTAENIKPDYQDAYMDLTERLDSQIPNLEKIVTSRLTQSDKQECLILWRQLQTCQENSKEWWDVTREIVNILLTRQHHDVAKAEYLEREEKRLSQMTPDFSDLKTKILELQGPDEVKAKLLSMYRTMMSYPEDSTYRNSLREEIEWTIRLPYDECLEDPHVKMNNSQLNQFYCQVRKELDQELYGMEEVKQKLLHILNDRRSSKDRCGRNLLLCGPPGTGKTQIGKVLARVLGKKFIKISAAGLDSAAIKGSNKVYVGSEPSVFLQSLAAVGTNNPVVMIDEAEKMDQKAQQAMIHVSDPADNMNFQDGFLKNGYHDLSRILFICNTNSVEGMDPAFLDRFDVLYIPGYNLSEQEIIFERYMLPKAIRTVGLPDNSITVESSVLKRFLSESTDLGLRTMERKIKNLVGRINMYQNVVLKNGKIGKLDLGYHIPKFRLPINIDYDLLCQLTQ